MEEGRSCEGGGAFLQSAIWNPQDFILLLLHDGHDLSANVGDAAGLDHTCNTERGGAGRGGVRDFQQRTLECSNVKWLIARLRYYAQV